ncbi:hypothetical protein D3C80_1955620 [compost metagenome]
MAHKREESALRLIRILRFQLRPDQLLLNHLLLSNITGNTGEELLACLVILMRDHNHGYMQRLSITH